MKTHLLVLLLAAAAIASPLSAQTSPAPSAAPAAPVPIDPEKRKMIAEMMELTQTAHFAEDMANQTVASMKAAMPTVPADFWTEFQKKVDAGELHERFVAAYDRYFTKQDLQAALAFYHTEIGQKLLSEMPSLTRDTMLAGQEWGQRTGQLAAQELDKRGLLKKASPSPSGGGSPAAAQAGSPKPTATPKKP